MTGAAVQLWLKGLSAVVLLAAAGALMLLVGECSAFRGETREDARPSPAPPTSIEERAAEVTLPCQTVVALEPTERDRRRLAERYGRPELATPAPPSERGALAGDGSAIPGSVVRILAERELPVLPAGGTALVTLEPDGRTSVTVKPTPEKLLEWRATWELGGLYGLDTEGETRGRAWAAVEPLRFGRIHLRGELGADVRAGVTDGYVMAGAVWRSR